MSTIFFSWSTDSFPAICLRLTVNSWPQLWSPTPQKWENWTWVRASYRIEEFSCSVLDWIVQAVNWRRSCEFIYWSHCFFFSAHTGRRSLQYGGLEVQNNWFDLQNFFPCGARGEHAGAYPSCIGKCKSRVIPWASCQLITGPYPSIWGFGALAQWHIHIMLCYHIFCHSKCWA